MLTIRPADPLDCLVSPLVCTSVPISDVQPYVDDYIVDFDDDEDDYDPYYEDFTYDCLDSDSYDDQD